MRTAHNGTLKRLDRLYRESDHFADSSKTQELRQRLCEIARDGPESLMIQIVADSRTRDIIAAFSKNFSTPNPFDDFVNCRSDAVYMEMLRHGTFLNVRRDAVKVLHTIMAQGSEEVRMKILRTPAIVKMQGLHYEPSTIMYLIAYGSDAIWDFVERTPEIGNLPAGKKLGAAALGLRSRFPFEKAGVISGMLAEVDFTAADLVRYLRELRPISGSAIPGLAEFMRDRSPGS